MIIKDILDPRLVRTHWAAGLGCFPLGSTLLISHVDRKVVNPIDRKTNSGSNRPVSKASWEERILLISFLRRASVRAWKGPYPDLRYSIQYIMRTRTYTRPRATSVNNIKLPLKLVEVLRQIIVCLDGLQITIVTHRNGEEKDVGSEIRRWSCSAMICKRIWRTLKSAFTVLFPH